MSFNFKCPVCTSPLVAEGKTLKCENNHCFDVAKQGYVNLLQSQKSSKKRHGDDALMVKSRQDFLEKGYYTCLCEGIKSAVSRYVGDSATLADLGCGECWYTQRLADFLCEQGRSVEVCGIDISKQALIFAARRCPSFHLAVASTADLPLTDDSCDVVLSVFAPCSAAEIHRVLNADGVWVKAFPLERHLMGLKSVIYEKPYENTVKSAVPEGFEQVDLIEICEQITLTSSEDIMNLFRMTPYYYKTGIVDQQKLESLQTLTTELEFGVSVYKKA